MGASYLESYLRDISRRLSIPTRGQDILIDRISEQKTYHWLSIKYGISRTRLNQIIRRFWHRLWVGTMAFSQFCKEESELIKELKRIRLYNPDRLNEVIDTDRARPIDSLLGLGLRSGTRPFRSIQMHRNGAWGGCCHLLRSCGFGPQKIGVQVQVQA